MSDNCHCDTGCYNPFSAVVSAVYDQLGNPTDYSPAQISGYFFSPSNLGKLNNSINGNYCVKPLYYSGANTPITGFEFKPCITPDVYAVYVNQFFVDYYQTLTSQILRGVGGVGQQSIQSLKEGDNQVVFANKSSLLATARGLWKDAKDNLDDSVRDYLRFQVGAGSVVFSEDIFSYQPYYGGFGAGPYGGWYGYGAWGIVPYGYPLGWGGWDAGRAGFN